MQHLYHIHWSSLGVRILFFASAACLHEARTPLTLDSQQDVCANNRFGPTCSLCPSCKLGRCDDGRWGSGKCKEQRKSVGAFETNRLLLVPGSDVVVTTYFTSKPEPQRRRKPQNGTAASTRWLRSAQDKKLLAVVLHDGLPESVFAGIDSDLVRFVQVNLNDRSINDQRFLLYRALLRNELVDVNNEVLNFLSPRDISSTRVLFTDMFDLEFYKNPFHIFFGKRYKLYVGSHEASWNRWLYARIRACRLNMKNTHSRYYNAGILGGPMKHVATFLDCFSNVSLSRTGKAAMQNCNMPIFAQCVMNEFAKEEVFTGKPLHSTFGGYEGKSSNIYIRHK